LKPLHLAIAAGAGVAVLAAIVYYATLPQAAGRIYTQGDFTVSVLEDSSSRFLAHVKNGGPALESAGAFGVKKGLNENCEPQGIVVANFDVRNQGGNPTPNPDSIPGDASVTLDSRRVPNLSVIPTGPDFETSVYILRFEPGSIRATDLIEKIPIQGPGSTEAELFEHCLQEHNTGYPLQLKLVNPQKDTQAFITITDASDRYETAISVGSNAPESSTLYWPALKRDWLAANYTQASGPAPAWNDQKQVHVSVSIVSGGEVTMFEDDVAAELATASLDFFELAKGNPIPSYPSYWEVQVDLSNRTVG
jgi:hypothetical protein